MIIGRIKFEKGKQREFLKLVLVNLDCPTLKELANRYEINYSTLKNYFNEGRLLPITLFDDLCYVSKIDKETLNFEIRGPNFGQVIGGKKSKRR